VTDLNSLTDSQLAAIAGEIDPDTDALVRTVWGEARNQDPMGRKAVAAVIRNRANLSGQPIRAVVQEPGQFEPWGDPKTRRDLEGLDPASDAYQAILADIEGDDDPTGGATHFYSPKGQAAKGRKPPKWDDGSGVDLGDHRFFKLSYGGQPASEVAMPSLEDMSDDELEAIANADAPMPTAGADADADAVDPIGDVEFISAPATAASGRKSTVVDAQEGKAATPAQEAFYVGQIKAGKLDPAKVRSGGYRAGTEEFPLLQRDPQDLPKPGDWYVTPEGEKRQVPEVPMLDTGINVARLLSDPSFRLMAQSGADVLDPRSEAMLRAVESGVMLGGRNEMRAGIESIPALFEGGVPMVKERFGDALEREDRASAKARRDFPIAYDASAVSGGLASGAVLPAGRLATAGIGAGSGFLATDGDLKDRAVGAGLGVLGGEVMRYAAPKLAGAALDLSGVPMRAIAGESVPSPLTGLPMASTSGSKAEVKAAEAVRRAMERDALSPGLIEVDPSDALPFQRGDNLTGLAEVVAQSPGPGQRIVRGAVSDQAAGASGRIKSEIATTLGGTGDYFDKLSAAKLARKTEADKTMSTLGRHEVTLDQDSVLALRSDLARSAVREQALNALASPDAEIRATGASLNRLYDDLLDKPGAQTITVRDAQNISRVLLDAADDAYRGGNGSRGTALKALGKSVRENASTPERGGFSEYGDWLKKYAEDSSGIDALEMGRKVFSPNLEMSADALRNTYKGWTDAAKENYRVGVGEAVLAAVRSKGGVAEARQLLKNEEFADRIRLAVPDDMSFKGFMSAMEREVDRAARNNRVVGGSPTYARQAAHADLKDQARDPLDVAAEGVDLILSPGKALTGKALKEALKAIPRKDRSVIGDEVANAALAKALTDQNEMSRLLNLLEHYRAAREIPMRQLPGAAAGVSSASLLEAAKN
jgi:hypothetical protein